MTLWIRLALLFGIALGLMACGQPKTAVPPQAAQYSWLDDSPCTPPCWQGIIPGTTTITATVDLLKANPTIRRVIRYNPTKTIRGDDYHIDWNWARPSEDGGDAYAFHGSVVVDILFLGFDDTPIALTTIRERFGAPSHARLDAIPEAHGNAVMWKLELIYLDRGMVLVDISSTPPLLETLMIDRVYFTQPDATHILAPVSDTRSLYVWREGAPLTIYCDENYNPERCRSFQ